MINDERYLKMLFELKDSFSIKVITGMRDTGRTQLLLSFADALKKQGITAEQIIYINFEETKSITKFQELYEFINEKIAYLEQAYLIFDEIQRIEGWEKTLNAFFVGLPVDIYIGISNVSVLSNDFFNLLSEHYEIIQIQPIPFENYLQTITNKKKIKDKFYFQQYLKYGGLPIILQAKDNSELLPILLSGIYHTILVKDIVARYGVRDVELIDEFNKCLALNIGNPITPDIIYSYLKNIKQNTTIYTIGNYLKMIHESGLFHRISRYDMKIKTAINGSERIYCADIGIRNLLSDFNDLENNAIIENIVCLELFRYGYKIFIGKWGKIPFNFVALKNSELLCLQIVQNINDKKVFRRVTRQFQIIDKQYKKIVISTETPNIPDYNGIKILGIYDFLTETDKFLTL